MPLFGRRKARKPLDRERSLSARPFLDRRVSVDRDADGNIVLHVPRRDTALVRMVARVFKMQPYRQVALDELGSFVIELCDGRHSVREIVDKLAKEYKLNRREAEVSTAAFLRSLAGRSIVGLLIEEGHGQGA